MAGNFSLCIPVLSKELARAAAVEICAGFPASQRIIEIGSADVTTPISMVAQEKRDHSFMTERSKLERLFNPVFLLALVVLVAIAGFEIFALTR